MLSRAGIRDRTAEGRADVQIELGVEVGLGVGVGLMGRWGWVQGSGCFGGRTEYWRRG